MTTFNLKKKIDKLYQFIQNIQSQKQLNQCSEDLANEANNLNKIISQYELAKEDNNKEYSEQIREGLDEIFSFSQTGLEKGGEMIQERNVELQIMKPRIEIFSQLANNLKSLNQMQKRK